MKRLMYSFFIKLRLFLGRIGLGRIPGVSTLGWFIHNRITKGNVLFNLQGNKIYVNAMDKNIFPILVTTGNWDEIYETELFKQMVKEGMVVVDIGAYVGYYTLIAAKLVGKRGIVYAFEPQPSSYELLCKNIEVNGYTNVVPIQKAVSNKSGRAKVWFQQDRGTSSSLSKYTALRFSRDEGLEKGSFTEVETIVLDEFFEDTVKNINVDIIKMDVEGAEGLVVDGARKILNRNNLKIFMEFYPPALWDLGTNPLELISKLQKYGFEIQAINEGKQVVEPMDDKKAEYTGNLFLEKL